MEELGCDDDDSEAVGELGQRRWRVMMSSLVWVLFWICRFGGQGLIDYVIGTGWVDFVVVE